MVDEIGRINIDLSEMTDDEIRKVQALDEFFLRIKDMEREDRERLNEVQRQIKRHLNNAVQLGMHEEELVLDMGVPGATLNVPMYIHSMCESYEVKISK